MEEPRRFSAGEATSTMDEIKPAGNAAAMDENLGEVSDQSLRITLYAVRHGEALHNIEEKIAKEQAKREGRDPEEARKAVLNDPELYDAELSKEGKRMARDASTEIEKLVAEIQLNTLDTKS